MRKFSLLILSGLVLLGTLGAAQSAFADEGNPICKDRGLQPGIYDSKFKKGKFNVKTSPTKQLVNAEVNANAILCGTDHDAGRYVKTVDIVTPGKKEKVRCGNPLNVSAYCEAQDGDLADGAFTGNANVDMFCYVPIFCIGGIPIPNVEARTFITYDTSNGGKEENRCDALAISCTETKGELVAGIVECNSDTIIRQNGKKFAYTIYSPDCYVFGVGPVKKASLLGINQLQICKFVGDPGSESCGNGSVPSNWQFKNSKCKKKKGTNKCKPVKWKAAANMSDGTTYKAKAKVKVTK